MGFSFNFFGESRHREFNYKPRYYDPAAEERKRIFGRVDGSLDGKASSGDGTGEEEYVPGKYITGSFRGGNYRRVKTSGFSKAQKIIGIVSLLLICAMLYYITEFYGML